MRFHLLLLLLCLPFPLHAGGKINFPVKEESAVPEPRVGTNLLEFYEKEKAELDASGILSRNSDELESLTKLKVCPSKKKASKQLATSVLRALAANPVAGKKGVAKYDPDRDIGFCFGRAAFVHLELLRRGVEPCRIAKIFAVGALQWEHARWEYHMATMVRDTGSTWWVIDSHYAEPMELEPWMKKVSKLAANKNEPLRFYATDATKFLALPGHYEEKTVYQEWYGTYFHDLLKTFEKTAPAKN